MIKILEDFSQLLELTRNLDTQNDMMDLLDFGSDDWCFLNAVFSAEYREVLKEQCEAAHD